MSASDFVAAKVGLGAFEHDALLLSFGRISDTEAPLPRQLASQAIVGGKARVVFITEDGQALEGEDSILWP